MNKQILLDEIEKAIIALCAYAYALEHQEEEQFTISVEDSKDSAIQCAVDNFVKTSLVVRPAGERCPHCNGTGRKKP